jgi:hypothetical protein
VLGGGLGGWLTAVGGAWKDAPIEGFSSWKFLRSPAVATAWGWLLLSSTADWLVVVVAAGGLSVCTIETYKTFLTGGRPPGKFTGKPVRFAARRVRHTCRTVHCGLYALLSCWLIGSLVIEGSGDRLHNPASASTGAVAVAATVMCALVLRSRLVPLPGTPITQVPPFGEQPALSAAMLGWWRTHAAPRPESARDSDADVDLRRKAT